jgi:hypothetical protein
VSKLLVVTHEDGENRFTFSRWTTEGELAVYDERGELGAVFAEGHWTKAVVIDAES